MQRLRSTGQLLGGGNKGNVGIGTTGPGTYDGEQAQLDVADYAAVDDVYLKNPKSGNPRWASATNGFISGYGSSMNLPGSGTYTVLCWATYFSCEDYLTHLRLDGTTVESHSGYGADSAGCDQNTIMIRLTGVSAGSHTWSFSRGSRHRYMWMAFSE